MPTVLVPGAQTWGAASQWIRLPDRTASDEAARSRAKAQSRLVGTPPDLVAYTQTVLGENNRRAAISLQALVTYPIPDGAIDERDRMQAQWWYPGNPPPYTAPPGSAVDITTGYLAPWGIIW